MKKRTVCLLLLMLPAVLFSSTVDAGGQRLIATAWTIEHGLPQNSVLCLIQARDGYLWFGTESGLVRFDGANFRVINRWKTPGLRSDRILTLFQDSRGTLWAGTDGGGISKLVNKKWVTYTTGQNLSDNTVQAIIEDKNGNLWLGTTNGLNRMKGESFTSFNIEHGLPAYSVTALALMEDSIRVGTLGGGIIRLQDNHFLPKLYADTFTGSEISLLHHGPDRALWIGTGDGLYYSEKPDAPKPSPLQHYLSGNSIRDLIQDSDGNLWVATDGGGLFRIPPKKENTPISSTINSTLNISTRHGLPDDFIHSLLQDNEGNMWLGTYTTGLVRLKSTGITSITTRNGLPENKIQTLLTGENGYLWIGTGRKGVALMEKVNDSFRLKYTITKKDGLSRNNVQALYQEKDKNGSPVLWVGTTSGLNRITLADNLGSIISLDIFKNFKGKTRDSRNITAVFRDNAGQLWVGTANGLFRLDELTGTASPCVLEKNPLAHHVRTITGNDKGNLGNLLVGTRGGLFILKDLSGAAPVYVAIPGPEPDFYYDITAVKEDSRGDLWAGTNGSGLIRLKKGDPATRTVFTTQHGLPSNYIFSINEDSSGSLWMSSYKGVFVQRRARPDADPQPGDFRSFTIGTYDEKEGMNSSECVMTGHPSASVTKTGRLFVPTVKGVAILDLPGITPAAAAPPVRIIQVTADNRTLPHETAGPPTLPENTQSLTIFFNAVHFTSPQKIRFRYKLEGFDDQWQEATALPGKEQNSMYWYLPPGDYAFNVIAAGNDSPWSETGSRFRFMVEAPFYKRALFYALLLLAATLLAAGIYLFLQRRKKDKELPGKTGEASPPGETREKYKTSALLPETVQQVLPKLNKLLDQEKVYLDPELTLKKLAAQLNVHYNHLSQIINEHLGKSFNDYINSYRIEEAKRKLQDPAEARKTVLEIAYDTGFYSKSVFNTAFKKFTGMTPTQYKKNTSAEN